MPDFSQDQQPLALGLLPEPERGDDPEDTRDHRPERHHVEQGEREARLAARIPAMIAKMPSATA